MSPKEKPYDFAVIGGGIVGLATAMTLAQRNAGSVLVLEAEPRLAGHQTGHNSGVIHAGLYYRPGSLKAQNCIAGRERLYRFCREYGLAHEMCGKLVVAVTETDVDRLRSLEKRGRVNGLDGLRRLGADELREYEPHARGREALHVPCTGIVDFSAVAEQYARLAWERDATIEFNARVRSIHFRPRYTILETEGAEYQARYVINCAGLQADRIARKCGLKPGLRIIPFRGEYYRLVDDRKSLVRNLIYPVPDPRFPFLGAHFTRTIEGFVEAGPNAVLAMAREGYRWSSVSARDVWSMVSYRGFWRMTLRHGGMGMGEIYRSICKRGFVNALRRLVPEITGADLVRHEAGVRAQAVGPDGRLLDDFHILRAERSLHVLNAPSPAATASLCIGEQIADMAMK